MADSSSNASATLAKARRQLEAGQGKQAIRVLQRLLDASPDEPEALELLGAALYTRGQPLEALRAWDRVIRLGVESASVLRRVGQALASLQEYGQAIDAFERSLSLEPNDAAANNDLGRAYYRLGEVDRAVELLKRAATFTHETDPVLGLATIIPSAPAAGGLDILAARQAFAARLRGEAASWTLPNRRSTERGRPIRVGYLSAHFDGENYMKPVWALINRHDRERVALHLFHDGETRAMKGYTRRGEDKIDFVAGDSNEQLARRIARADLDVLVDLSAYSKVERLALFAARLPTVTVAWFNMYATSGLPGFDYIIGDDEVAPTSEDDLYCERVLRLPQSYLTFEVTHDAPDVVDPPCLKSGVMTFGTLATQYKINPSVLDLWARILRKARNSRLFIANTAMKSPHNRDWLRACFRRRRIDPDRVTLLGPADHRTFLRYYNQIDVALDTFPYNGGTTTMEAVWQGVPVLTVAGDRWAARTSQTLLRRTHLAEFVAESSRAMVRQAVRLAKSRDSGERLRALRRGMRAELGGASACDAAGLARGMEALLEEIAAVPLP